MRLSGAPSTNQLTHAVVMGGSIAGLLAARALSGHAERVTLVERDPLPENAATRKGVPQGDHVHALLIGGQVAIERLFPGIATELCAAGAVVVDAGRELTWFHGGRRRSRSEGGLTFLSMSRPLLESCIARRLRAVPNVVVLDATRATGLLGDGGRITGIRAAGEGRAAGRDAAIAADLVVDALGRGSPVQHWLGALGVALPEPELIPARIAYASCLVRLPARGRDWQALIVGGAPARRRGLIFPVEGGRWLATVVGYFDEPMPDDYAGFAAFAGALPVPALAQALAEATPLSPVMRYRFAGSLRRRYERLPHVPDGLIAVGDAACSFNPVFGQGMSVAALEAERLLSMLAEATAPHGLAPGFGRRWCDEAAGIVDRAWGGVLIEDLRLPELASLRPTRLKLMQWYMDRLHRATYRSAAVTDRFYRVINFLDEPAALLQPRLVADVLSGGRIAFRPTQPLPPLQGREDSDAAASEPGGVTARSAVS